MTGQYNERIDADELLPEECRKRFDLLLKEKFDYEVVDDKGTSVVFHYKITIDSIPITAKFYSTGTLHLSASPKLDTENFQSALRSIQALIDQCTESILEKRPLSTIRAKEIINFVERLDIGDEHQRIVSLVLCDTSNEIILTELMKNRRIDGPPLREGVMKKISYLENKDVTIPFKDELSNVREIRNDAVHNGNIPSKGQTQKALEISLEFLHWM